MKRKIFLSIIFVLFSCLSVYPEKNVSGWLQFEFGRSASKGLEHDLSNVSAVCDFQFFDTEVLAAVRNDTQSFDFTGKIFYIPFSFEFEKLFINLGFDSYYHQLRYMDISEDHDVVLDTVFELKTKKGFAFRHELGWTCKWNRIYALEPYIDPFFDHSVSMIFSIEKKWQSGMELFFSLGSHNLYRYNLFVSPCYDFGAAYTINNLVRFNGAVEIQMSDQYTAAPMLKYMQIKFGTRFIF